RTSYSSQVERHHGGRLPDITRRRLVLLEQVGQLVGLLQNLLQISWHRHPPPKNFARAFIACTTTSPDSKRPSTTPTSSRRPASSAPMASVIPSSKMSHKLPCHSPSGQECQRRPALSPVNDCAYSAHATAPYPGQGHQCPDTGDDHDLQDD